MLERVKAVSIQLSLVVPKVERFCYVLKCIMNRVPS